MLSIKCPNCGGTVQFDEQHIATFCSFCGSHLPDMTNYVEEAIKINQERERHQMEMEKLDKKMKREKRENISDFIASIPVIILVIAFLYLMIKILT